jgi:hypothetical protein
MEKTAASGNRRSPELAKFCQEALVAQRKNASDLFAALKRASDNGSFRKALPPESEIRRFLDGKRKSIGIAALRVLGPEICPDPQQRTRYNQLVGALKDDSLAAARIDAIRTYRYLSVPYPPLSGPHQSDTDTRHPYFMEKLLAQLGQLAYLEWLPAQDETVATGHFDMNYRVDAARSGRAHVLINLVSLPSETAAFRLDTDLDFPEWHRTERRGERRRHCRSCDWISLRDDGTSSVTDTPV